jgi:hypothetical protein
MVPPEHALGPIMRIQSAKPATSSIVTSNVEMLERPHKHLRAYIGLHDS